MITQAQLQDISKRIEADELTDALITKLRSEFSPLHFTFCMDDDVCDMSPVMETEKFNLYLIDGREHCLKLTNDYEAATGLVVAEIIADS